MIPRTILAAGVIAAGLMGQIGSAEAQGVPIDLGRYCAAKYQPRGIQATAEPIRWTVHGPQLLCRLVRVPTGYTLDSQSPEEVCRFQIGSSAWAARNPHIYCGGATAASPQTPLRTPRACFRTATGLVCR